MEQVVVKLDRAKKKLNKTRKDDGKHKAKQSRDGNKKFCLVILFYLKGR